MRGAAEPVIAGCREERHRGAGNGPEASAEDRAHRGPDLLQIAVVRLASGRVAVVAGRDREADAAAGERAEEVLLILIVAVRIDEPPVAEDRERERLRGAGRCLRHEHGGVAGSEQVDAAEHHAVAILSGARQREGRLPLVLADGPDLDRRARRALRRGKRARRAIERPIRHRRGRSRLVGREVHDHVQADEVGQVRRAGEMRVVGRGAHGTREAESRESRNRKHRERPHGSHDPGMQILRQCIQWSILIGKQRPGCNSATSPSVAFGSTESVASISQNQVALRERFRHTRRRENTSRNSA